MEKQNNTGQDDNVLFISELKSIMQVNQSIDQVNQDINYVKLSQNVYSGEQSQSLKTSTVTLNSTSEVHPSEELSNIPKLDLSN